MVLDWCCGLAGGWFCGVGIRGDTFWEGICQWQKVQASLEW